MSWVRYGRSFRLGTSGATAIEFALVVGPLLLLLVGTIEVGRLLWTGHALDEVAIAGARCIGIQAPDCASGSSTTPDQAITYIQTQAQSRGVVLGAGDISFDTSSGCGVQTGFMRVVLTLQFTSVIPGLAGTRLESEACFPSQV